MGPESLRVTTKRLPWLLTAVLLILFLLLLLFGTWRSTSTGAQVQVPMFYDAHYLFPRPWTQQQEAPGVPAPAPVAFYGVNTISQPFVSGADNLEMVEIWLDGPPYTAVNVILADVSGPLYEGTVFLPEQRKGQYYRLQFPAIAEAEGREFWLHLQAAGTDADGPAVTRIIGGDKVGGAVHLNEYGRPGNLELRTYVGGTAVFDALAEQLLPDLFRLRLQQFKPAPFKGQAFAILLGLMIILTIVFLILARPSGQTLAQAIGWTAVGLFAGLLFWQIGNGRVQIPISLLPQNVRMTEGHSNVLVHGNGLRIVNDMIVSLWTANREPEERFIETSLDDLPAVQVPGDSLLEYTMDVPRNGRFDTAVASEGGDMLFSVLFNDETLADVTAVAGAEAQSISVDLAHLAGQGGKLQLKSQAMSGTPEGYWLQPQLLSHVDWLLSSLPDEAQSAGHRLGDDILLAGYSLQEHSDGTMLVTLFWRTERPLSDDATVFVHFLDENGELLAQSDSRPVQNSYPLSVWPVDVIIGDEHILPAVNAASLAVGLYHPVDFGRWPVKNPDGTVDPDGRVLLPLE